MRNPAPWVVVGGWAVCKMTSVKQECSCTLLCSQRKLQAGITLHEAPSAATHAHNLCFPYFSGCLQAVVRPHDSKISDLSHVILCDREMLMGRNSVLEEEKKSKRV